MIRRFIGIAAVAIMMVSCNEQKTAYVDTTKIVQEYKEMKEVEADFSSKSDSVRQKLDSVALYACVLGCLTLLMLLFGQRIAKDYAGAFTLTGYFIVCMFGVYIMS